MLKKEQILKLFLSFIYLFLFQTSFVFALRVGDPDSKWLQIETPHFTIVHLAKHQDLGQYYANIAEQSYAEVKTVFQHLPYEKVVVIINDSTDSANGYTTLIPYPHIMIYPVQVEKGTVLSESAEWAKELFIHELTHIMQLYPAEGVYRYIKPIMGTIVAPNLLMPTWWKEGMAVEIESEFSHKGRTKSYFQDASLRALADDNQLMNQTLPMANEALPSWPYGSRPYLFGSVIMSYSVSQTQPSVLNDLVSEQASRIPYAVERPYENNLHMSLNETYVNALAEQNKISLNQIQQISSKPTTQLIKPEFSGLKTPYNEIVSSRQVKVNFENIIGLYALDKNKSKLVLFKKENNQLNKLNLKKIPTGTLSGFSFHPFKPLIVVGKIDLVDINHEYSDFYIYNYQEESVSQITKSLRGRDPMWSADGEQIYYINSADGLTSLNSLNPTTQEITTLVTTSLTKRIHEFALFNEHALIYSIKNELGENEVFLFDLNTKTTTPFVINKSQAENFQVVQNNLYFTSPENGVYNLYKKDLSSHKEIALTNFKTGLLDFTVDSKNNIFWGSIFTTNGTELYQFNPHEYTDLPHVDNPIKKRYHYVEQKIASATTTTEDYSPYQYLYPHYFIPYFYQSSQNEGYTFQVMTSGHDPLHRHEYNLNLDYTSHTKSFNYNFDYLYSNMQWPLFISALKTETTFGDINNKTTKKTNSFGFQPNVFDISSDLTVSAGIRQRTNKDSSIDTEHVGVFAQAMYSNIEQSLFQIYPTHGVIALISGTQYKAKNDQGNSLLSDYYEYTGSLSFYLANNYFLNHTLLTRLNGLYIPEKVTYRFGTSTSSLPQFSDSYIPEFVARGYTSGQFFGTQLYTLNEEYRFSIKDDVNMGSGSWPFFMKNLKGAFIVDGVSVKGYSQLKDLTYETETLKHSYWSVGAELRSDVSIGYVIPMTVILGVYNPLSSKHQSSVQTALGLQVTGF